MNFSFSQLRSSHRTSSQRVFGLLLLALLSAGGAVAPLKLAAQESAPAASAPASAAPYAPKTQEEQNNVFRLEGPIVKWTARTLNLQPEAAARSFEFLNFFIIVLLVGIPVARILPKVFRQRSATLVANLKAAREATTDANARLSAVEAKLAGLDDEIKKFRAQVEAESREDEARIKASIQEESARIVQAAEQELNVAAAQAQRSLRHFAADLAVDQAARQLALTPETDRALISEFVSGVSTKNGSGKGGKY